MPADANPNDIFAYLGSLQRRAVEELYFPFRPTPKTWELHRVASTRGADDRLIKKLKSKERSHLAHELVYHSGIKEIWPDFLEALKPLLRFEEQRSPRRVNKALLKTMRKHATRTVDCLLDICRDARDPPGPRLEMLLTAYDLKRVDALCEYLSFRSRYSASESLGNLARIDQLHQIALEHIRYHPEIAELRAESLLYRLAHLAERATFREHHPIAEDP